jgi:EmrB/QacA subfamily drug resistance transporter
MTTKVSNKKRSLILINILISCIASTMLMTALTTALPAIVGDLHITVTIGQWLTSGYSLAMGIMMPVTAFLITRFKTKRLYLTAIILFIVGLVVCMFANNFPVMMVGRVLQAAGNGILSSMAQVILLSIYPMEKRGQVMGWYGLSIGAAPVIAPTIAGILVDSAGWRMIFYAVAVVMLVSLIFAAVVFDNVLEVEKKKFDIASFVLSAIAFGGITVGIGNIGSYALLSLTVAFPLLLGILCMVLFAYRQFHMEKPFLDLSVLKDRNYTTSLISSMLLYLVMMGSSIILPLYVQQMRGYSATISGLVTLPGSLCMMVVSPFAGRIYDHFGIKKLFIIGSISMLISNIGMVFITLEMSVLVAATFNALRSLAVGFLLMPLVTWGMNGIPRALTAHGSALINTMRTISGAIGTAIFVSIMTSIGKHSVGAYGKNAAIHGLNMTFICMGVVTLIMLIVAVFFAREHEEQAELLSGTGQR